MTDLISTKTPLSVIGFDAKLDELNNIDFVEAVLYRGDVFNSTSLLHDNESELFNTVTTRVLNANKLQANDVVLITINSEDENKSHSVENDYFASYSVETLSQALLLASKISNDNQAVLILSAQRDKTRLVSEASTISFDDNFTGYACKHGVGALLVANAAFVEKNKSVVYSTIEALVSETTQSVSGSSDIITKALQQSGVTAENISSIEISACVNNSLSQIEQQLLLKNYSTGKKLNTSISCQKSVLGENGALSEVLGLINSVINLHQRYRAGIKDWQSPACENVQKWQDSNFYIFNQAAPVFPNESGTPRYSAFSCINEKTISHLILKENKDDLAHTNGFNACSAQTLFILDGDDECSLLHKLATLKITKPLKQLARQLYEQHSQQANYKVVLIAETIEELQKEITLALIGVKQAFENKSDWKTPKGSYFTTQSNKNAKVAFLYPGIGATYVGLGRDLFHLFPKIYPNVIKIADNIGSSLKDELLNPRSVISLDFKALKKQDLALRNDLANIAECGVGYACVFTKIFEDVFKIKADFATGYSMGEISMFAALGCWKKPGLMSARLAASDTFNHQLSSELRAIRKLWNLPEVANGTFEQIWETYAIKGTLSQVNAAIQNDERVFVTIINTTDSLVVGGYPEDCLKVIKRLGVRAMPMNMANAIHSNPAYQEYDNMLALYSMAVTERITTKMISSSCYLPIPQMQKAIAVSISKCLCEVVDFPRLINTLTNRGASVFIEMGAGRSLSSWTDKILKEADKKTNHISVAINAKGTNDQLTFARAVAKLVSYGVDVNIDSFFNGSIIKQL